MKNDRHGKGKKDVRSIYFCPSGQYQKRTVLAREVVETVLDWIPEQRKVYLIGDTEYACREVVRHLAKRIIFAQVCLWYRVAGSKLVRMVYSDYLCIRSRLVSGKRNPKGGSGASTTSRALVSPQNRAFFWRHARRATEASLG